MEYTLKGCVQMRLNSMSVCPNYHNTQERNNASVGTQNGKLKNRQKETE